MPIDTPRELREHIALAIQVELTTVPAYLYAMYSLEDQASDAARLIRSVAVEEMMHAALMANLLLGVGGEPEFANPSWMPRYPGALPHHVPELVVNLEPCSPEVIDRVFLTIERPEVHEAPPQPDHYESLGQFYHALEIAIEQLDDRYDLFAAPQLERQLTDPAAYRTVEFDSETSGGLVGVVDCSSAMQAIETVIHQGEGLSEERYADPEHRELTHYAKFLELADGTVPLGAVRLAVTNPTIDGLPGTVRPVAELANALYTFTFVALDRIYSPGAVDRSAHVRALYAAMSDHLGVVARYLMTLDAGDDLVAGPPFAHYAFSPARTPEIQLVDLASVAAAHHPALEKLAAVIEAVG